MILMVEHLREMYAFTILDVSIRFHFDQFHHVFHSLSIQRVSFFEFL
jgi:hypothetical protein